MSKEWLASQAIKEAARRLRRESTPAERRLWSALRRHQVDGLYFRRQHPVECFILDFCCVERQLVVEVDGAVHQFTGERDLARQRWLEANGYHVVRFSNDEVISDLDGVVEAIRQAAREYTRRSSNH